LQKFGSIWTTQKLDAVDNYLAAYIQINLYKNGKILDENREILNQIMGATNWETEIVSIQYSVLH